MANREQMILALKNAKAQGDDASALKIAEMLQQIDSGNQPQQLSQPTDNKTRMSNLVQSVTQPVQIDNSLFETKLEEKLKFNSENGVFMPLSQVREQVKAEIENPQKEKTEIEKLVERQGGLDAFLINSGKVFNDIVDVVGESMGFDPVKDRTQVQQMAIDLLKKERPISSFLGEVAPAAATLATGIVPATIVGGLEGAALSKDTPEEDALKGAGIGAGVAATAEVLFPKISKLARGVFRRFKGTNNMVKDGIPTEAFQKKLDEADLSYDEIKNAGITPEDLIGLNENGIREKFFKSQGITPTRGQITQNARDLLEEEDFIKSSKGRIFNRSEEQDRILRNKTEDFINTLGGNKKISSLAPDASENLNFTDFFIKDYENVAFAEQQLYKKAAEEFGDSKIIDLKPLLKTIKDAKGVNSQSIPILNDYQNQLINIIKENKDSNGLVDVKTTEDFVQFINSKLNPSSPTFREINNIARIIKDQKDDIVINRTGSESYKKARQEAAKNFKLIERDRINKYDTSNRNIVKNLIAGDIDQRDIVNKVVTSKSVRPKDLLHVKDYLNAKGEGGKQAFDDLRTQTIDQIYQNSLNNAGNFNSKRFSDQIESIGTEKLNILFNRDEIKEIEKLKSLIEQRFPRGKGIGKGPSSVAISEQTNLLDIIPVASFTSKLFKDYARNIADKKGVSKPETKTLSGITADLTEKINNILNRNFAVTEATTNEQGDN